MIKEIAYTAYPAKDVKAMRAWYHDNLGLSFKNPYEESGTLMYDEAEVGNNGWFSLMAAVWLGATPGGASGIVFEVDDIEKTKSELGAKGVDGDDIYDTPVCRVFSVKDLEGNKVAFHQRTV
jgi:catechol 2,3-dioxygenase-like lactoylglutathione lyase family enzyme